MRIFAISDLHINYSENRRWLYNLSRNDYKEDVLLLAGDISEKIALLEKAFDLLRDRFKAVLYTPGNHDLWIDNGRSGDSIAKFHLIEKIAADFGVGMTTKLYDRLCIVPLFGWYDYSFGSPSLLLRQIWMDYTECKWPNGYNEYHIAHYFTEMNPQLSCPPDHLIISFSHFVPRIDLMPDYIPRHNKVLFPVLGSALIERQIRKLSSSIHVYGHSHLNRCVMHDNTLYINNAFGYPHEARIAAKELRRIIEV